MELCSFLTLDSFITDPLTHDFMRKALLMSSLVAAVCGFLSSYLTLKGWALMGDAVSHSVMPGVVAYGETSEVFTPENITTTFGGISPDFLFGPES